MNIEITFSTKDSQQFLAQQLNLPYEHWMQDWEIEVADATKLDIFINYFQESFLSKEQQFALMELILHSLEDFLQLVDNEDSFSLQDFDVYWQQIRQVLFDEQELYFYVIKEFYVYEAETNDELMLLSPFIRGLPLRSDVMNKIKHLALSE